MVTIKNDIESSGVFIPTSQQPVKDVNLKQEGARQQPRRRSYRCVTIVSVVVLLLIGLGVGSVLYFGPALNRSPTTEANGGRTVATATTEEPSSSQPPTFSDPDDRTSDGPEIVVTSAEDSDDDGEGIDIDEPATSSSTSTSSTSTTSTTTTTTTTTFSPQLIDGGSGDNSDSSDDDDDTEEYDSGSGSGFGGL